MSVPNPVRREPAPTPYMKPGRHAGRLSLACGLAVAFAMAALVPSGARAQVRLIPQVGLYAPVADLGSIGGAGDAVDFGKKESTLAYGGALEFGEVESALAFRIGALYASESEVPIDGVGCEGTACDTRSKLLTATGAIVLRPVSLVVIRPYALVGVGAKRYGFSGDTSFEDLGDGETKLAGQLGAGLELNLGILRAVAELSDYMSSIDLGDESGDLQHDFFFTVGLILGG